MHIIDGLRQVLMATNVCRAIVPETLRFKYDPESTLQIEGSCLLLEAMSHLCLGVN